MKIHAPKTITIPIKTYRFHSCGMMLGDIYAVNENRAKELFAINSGYKSWQHMADCSEEFGGLNVEVECVTD